MLKHIFSAGLLTWLAVCGLQAAEPDDAAATTTKIVEEKTVTETRKVYETQTPAPTARKTAIIVDNRAGTRLDDKVAVLEDLLTTRIAGKGFTVLTRDTVTRSLKDYSGKPANTETPGTGLDQALENSTTALRLAQNLGADFILAPTITTYGTEKRTYNGNGIATVNTIHTVRVGYKLVEAGEGSAIKGATVVATKTLRDSGGLSVESSDVLNELLDNAAGQLADALDKAARSVPATVAKAALVNFSVACTMTDPRQQPIQVPVVSITADNHAIVTNRIPVQALDVTVELDGTTLGSAPGSFKARPGLHKIRLSREGFAAWERTINVSEGQELRVALQMSEQGYSRWKDTTDFLATLDNTRKLTDAEVKQIEGVAKFFSESHYRVDTKENIRINKSLW
jgi:hypothetical protein